MRIKPIFRWYDLWVGFFYDRKKRHLYFFYLPTLGLLIDFNAAYYAMFNRISMETIGFCTGDGYHDEKEMEPDCDFIPITHKQCKDWANGIDPVTGRRI